MQLNQIHVKYKKIKHTYFTNTNNPFRIEPRNYHSIFILNTVYYMDHWSNVDIDDVCVIV